MMLYDEMPRGIRNLWNGGIVEVAKGWRWVMWNSAGLMTTE